MIGKILTLESAYFKSFYPGKCNLLQFFLKKVHIWQIFFSKKCKF